MPLFMASGTPEDILKFSDKPPTATFIFIFESLSTPKEGISTPLIAHCVSPLTHLQITLS